MGGIASLFGPGIAESTRDQSPFGMNGMSHRVWDWTETPVGSLFHGIRSGSWFQGNNRQAAGRFYSNPSLELGNIGFRIARPPEQTRE